MSALEKEKITIRQPRRIKSKVLEAARLRGMTATSFINSVLEEAADQTIERARSRDLSPADSAALIEMLRNPGAPSEGLTRAAARYREMISATEDRGLRPGEAQARPI